MFLDTAYVIALLNPNDIYRRKAGRLLSGIGSAREIWTTEAVLTEVCNSLSRSNRNAASSFIDGCYTSPNVRVINVSKSLFRRAMELYRDRNDKEWGLTDCISFIAMTDNDITTALTNDKHFMQAGFKALLP